MLKPTKAGQLIGFKADPVTAQALDWLGSQLSSDSRTDTIRTALLEACTRRGAKMHYYTAEDAPGRRLPGRPPVEGFFFPPTQEV